MRFPGLSNPKALHSMTFQGLSQSRETLRALAVFQLSLMGEQKKESMNLSFKELYLVEA